jgi:hypothetical protein
MNDKTCPVCLGSPATMDNGSGLVWIKVSCQRCGIFHIDEHSWYPLQIDVGSAGRPALLGSSGSRERANASSYVREHQNIRIGREDVEWLARLKTPSFQDRADRLLLALERETPEIGEAVDLGKQLGASRWVALAWCRSEGELRFLLEYLRSVNRVVQIQDQSSTKETIKPDGFAHLESLRERGAATSQGFIAMNMAESTDSLTSLYHQGLEAGIEAAGYKPLRIDRKLDTDKLDDEILAEIRRSRFLVADLTGHRQSVYLELGFALGLGMRAFRTCRADQVGSVAFDQRTYLCMTWLEGRERELAKTLADRIVARLGPGPNKPAG